MVSKVGRIYKVNRFRRVCRISMLRRAGRDSRAKRASSQHRRVGSVGSLGSLGSAGSVGPVRSVGSVGSVGSAKLLGSPGLVDTIQNNYNRWRGLRHFTSKFSTRRAALLSRQQIFTCVRVYLIKYLCNFRKSNNLKRHQRLQTRYHQTHPHKMHHNIPRRNSCWPNGS
jgi:hypothetical protein